MRKFGIIAAVLTGSLALAACGQKAEEAAPAENAAVVEEPAADANAMAPVADANATAPAAATDEGRTDPSGVRAVEGDAAEEAAK